MLRLFHPVYNLGHWLVDICEIWQKVPFLELAKSAYFRSASSESDNKLFSVEGLGTTIREKINGQTAKNGVVLDTTSNVQSI